MWKQKSFSECIIHWLVYVIERKGKWKNNSTSLFIGSKLKEKHVIWVSASAGNTRKTFITKLEGVWKLFVIRGLRFNLFSFNMLLFVEKTIYSIFRFNWAHIIRVILYSQRSIPLYYLYFRSYNNLTGIKILFYSKQKSNKKIPTSQMKTLLQMIWWWFTSVYSLNSRSPQNSNILLKWNAGFFFLKIVS